MAFTLPNTITPGTPENANQVQQNDAAIRDELNAVTQTAQLTGAQLQNNTIGTSQIAGGGVYADNIRSSDNDKLGLSSTGVVRRGAVSIATSEARTNTAYGTLTTPDQIANVVLPANGLIVVGYQATWQESVASAGRAAIFIGSNQLKYALGASSVGGAPAVQEATTQSASQIGQDTLLGSCAAGLASAQVNASTAYTGDVTTGQVMGAWELNGTGGLVTPGPCHIFAAAGTYTVSVQFKATSGTVTAKNRTLRVWTIGF